MTAEPPPVVLRPGDADSGAIVLCDHAMNRVPAAYGDLGLPAGAFERHIAYDIGALGVADRLAARLGASLIHTTTTRLLIDPNRGRDDPTLVMKLSDGQIVPGNRHADRAEVERRIAAFHAPYHAAISAEIERLSALGRPPVIVSIHSYTPVWKGAPRPWHAAVLWDSDPRLNRPLIRALAEGGRFVIGDNEPYDGALQGDTLWQHATCRGLAHTLIEVRQDLIADAAGQEAWAGRIHAALSPLLDDPDVRRVAHFGSRAGLP